VETKNQQGRKSDCKWWFYIFMCKGRRKNRKRNYEEGGEKQTKQNS